MMDENDEALEKARGRADALHAKMRSNIVFTTTSLIDKGTLSPAGSPWSPKTPPRSPKPELQRFQAKIEAVEENAAALHRVLLPIGHRDADADCAPDEFEPRHRQRIC